MSQMKEQNKTPDEELNKTDKESTTYTVQNTGYKETQ